MDKIIILPSHSPEQRPLVSSLSTIQGSFPCSNKEITAGLELESPDHKKRHGTWLCCGVPEIRSSPLVRRKRCHCRKDQRKMKMKLQPTGAAHFQFCQFHFNSNHSLGNKEQKFSWLLETINSQWRNETFLRTDSEFGGIVILTH